MAELFAGPVAVQYGQDYLALEGGFDGAMEACFAGQSNGLCGARNPALLFLVTGLHTGVVGLGIHLFAADPGLDESWEEIVELSCRVPRGEITLMEWAADRGTGMAVPAGAYRVRYQARAMQAASELDTLEGDTPIDTYRLDLWPAPPSPDCIMKQSSAVAASWHGWAQRLGPGR
ncbi:hypothetical protein [Pseudoroseomonas cervicalis]|uniref:hypothetical protein n=1 Tax=Teichococcus cervicalis TaxID=204525 RepID=UPI002783694B|nr:hypothetical protein [Pseudoroseomonas cervicalis]MDQ1080253.1 hypothetical protein [Pseudoroseomonas cervicalis]